jgi:phospholipid/cholesterol/gamma-HCH transport system permease protein
MTIAEAARDAASEGVSDWPRQAGLDSRRVGERLELRPSGSWTTRALAPLEARLAALSGQPATEVSLDLSDVSALDTAGALLVLHCIKALEQRGAKVAIEGADEVQRALLDTVARHDVPTPAPGRPESPIAAVVIHVGRVCFILAGEARAMVGFLGHTLIVFGRALLQPRRIRVTALVSHMERTGLDALPIVGLISFLIGVVLAYQGADQLARFGAQIYTVNLVGIGVLREMGIILTAIMVAGRSGSAFTAQIGTMQVNEEIDAMRTIGLDPMDMLVIPRVLALVLVLPLLTFYADILGIAGGAVMAMLVLDISAVQFIRQLNTAVPIWAFWVGIIKAPIFAFIIGMVGCYEGFRVTRSAESVGLRTTAAVVKSIFLVIVLDALFSILFSVLGV